MFFPFYLSCINLSLTYFPIISCFFSLNQVGFNFFPFLSNIFRLFWFIYFMLFFPFQQHFSSSNVCTTLFTSVHGSCSSQHFCLFLRLAVSYLSMFIFVFLFLLYKFYSSSFSRHFILWLFPVLSSFMSYLHFLSFFSKWSRHEKVYNCERCWCYFLSLHHHP